MPHSINKSMLLAIDTSTRYIGIALYDGTQVVNEMVWTSDYHHTVELAPAVELGLRRAGLGVEELEVIGVALGPGSYTALRIGIAYAKGLALSQHIPLVGIPTMDFLAAAQPVRDVLLATVLEAGRKRLAVGWYRSVNGNWQKEGELELLTPKELSNSIRGPTMICGEMNAKARTTLKRKWTNAQLVSPAQSQRRPAFLAELAWKRWRSGKTDNPTDLVPIYLSHKDNLK